MLVWTYVVQTAKYPDVSKVFGEYSDAFVADNDREMKERPTETTEI